MHIRDQSVVVVFSVTLFDVLSRDSGCDSHLDCTLRNVFPRGISKLNVVQPTLKMTTPKSSLCYQPFSSFLQSALFYLASPPVTRLLMSLLAESYLVPSCRCCSRKDKVSAKENDMAA